MILLFSIFTPLGIIIGMILESKNTLLTGIFLGLSGGTFLYVSASEVIVEEFTISRNKFTEYILFLIGAIFIAALCYLEI